MNNFTILIIRIEITFILLQKAFKIKMIMIITLKLTFKSLNFICNGLDYLIVDILTEIYSVLVGIFASSANCFNVVTMTQLYVE